MILGKMVREIKALGGLDLRIRSTFAFLNYAFAIQLPQFQPLMAEACRER